jgi:hypothetical protein
MQDNSPNCDDAGMARRLLELREWARPVGEAGQAARGEQLLPQRLNS